MKNYNYFGLFVDNSTKCELVEKYLLKANKIITDLSNFYCDHVTLMHVSQHNEKQYKILKHYQGKQIPIKITGIGYSDKAIAFRVDLGINSNLCINKIPHITIATRSGGKPVDSNFITDWVDIDPFTIQTKLSYM